MIDRHFKNQKTGNQIIMIRHTKNQRIEAQIGNIKKEMREDHKKQRKHMIEDLIKEIKSIKSMIELRKKYCKI